MSIIKTTGMMIGESDMVTYFMADKNNYFTISILMVSVFLIIMPITLFNLIVSISILWILKRHYFKCFDIYFHIFIIFSLFYLLNRVYIYNECEFVHLVWNIIHYYQIYGLDQIEIQFHFLNLLIILEGFTKSWGK